MKTRLFAAIVVLLAVLAASCGEDTTEATVESAGPATDDRAEDVAAGDAPVIDEAMDDASADDTGSEGSTADDAADTAALADETAIRIVSLSPTATEMVFAIGAGDQVVAVDSFSYYPPEAPVTDLSGFEPNLEAIAGYEPTMVLSQSPIEGLDALGIENLVLPAAVTLDDVYAQIEQLGATTGRVGDAAELVGQMQSDIDDVLAGLPDRDDPLSYYHELDPTLYSVTSQTFIGHVYSLLGLENAADPADEDGSAFGYPQLNEEYLVTADPDIIFLADTICCEQSAQTVGARPGWEQLRAVQNGNVIELDDDIVSRWGPRIVDFVQVAGEAVAAVDAAPAS